MNDLNVLKKPLLEKFLHYVSYNTQSKENVRSIPSTLGQRKLGMQLKHELIELGLQEIEVTKQGVLTAFLPANTDHTSKTISFISHLDTPPNCSGKNIHPEVITNYRGGDISLGNGDEFISPVHYHFLQRLVGKNLIVGDGKNLLGLNKASIAEIMVLLDYLTKNNIPHCNLRIAFIPDKEVRMDVDFPIQKFNSDAIFYLESGQVGEFSLDSLYSADVLVTFYGRTIHTGYAKNKMKNALALACEFQQLLPMDETPEMTEGKDGFYHLKSFTGNLEKAELSFSICDFDEEKFKDRYSKLTMLVSQFNENKKLYKKIEIQIKNKSNGSIEKHANIDLIQKIVVQAITNNNLIANLVPFRGNSVCKNLVGDASPCITLFTGGNNLHSKQEFITLEEMLEGVKVLLEISRV